MESSDGKYKTKDGKGEFCVLCQIILLLNFYASTRMDDDSRVVRQYGLDVGGNGISVDAIDIGDVATFEAAVGESFVEEVFASRDYWPINIGGSGDDWRRLEGGSAEGGNIVDISFR
jgi:hypothetical protein